MSTQTIESTTALTEVSAGIIKSIERAMSEGGLHVFKTQSGNAVYINGVPKNIKAGVHKPTTLTYAVTGQAVFGPGPNYQAQGQLFHALTLNIEEDLSLFGYTKRINLPPNSIWEPQNNAQQVQH